MANRVLGNVIVIDSAMGNQLALTAGNVNELKVNAIAFLSIDTTANITLTYADTATDVVYKLDYLAGHGASGNYPNPLNFSEPQRLSNLKVPRLTAGTGFLYLA